ncbi:MAG: hypothetical protein M3209_03395 [Acidobacteriota bacterium]|nr:hypothetical protein [Acidobacteriota bacterium]
MGKFLFTIQETFQLEAIGLVVAINIKFKDANLKNGDEIELRQSERPPLITRVAAIPMFNPYDPERLFSFCLPKNINKKDVPIGTEVWSCP